jgi:hypothetical protein
MDDSDFLFNNSSPADRFPTQVAQKADIFHDHSSALDDSSTVDLFLHQDINPLKFSQPIGQRFSSQSPAAVVVPATTGNQN